MDAEGGTVSVWIVTRVAIAIALALLTAAPGAARAAPVASAVAVAPGEEVTLNRGVFVPPAGDLLAEQTRTLSFHFTAPFDQTLDPAQPVNFSVPFRQAVLRDSVTRNLTFFYDFTAPPAGSFFDTLAAITFDARDFSGVGTYVDGDAGVNTLSASRSDGDGGRTVTFASIQVFDGATVPHLSILTYAAAFDRAGSADVQFIKSFLLQGSTPSDPRFADATASMTLPALFEPARPATAIPLPPGGYVGLAGLLIAACARAYPRLTMGS